MNNKAHLRPQDFDSNGDIIPMAWKEADELAKVITEKKNAIWNDIELLTALKVHCEEPYCRAIDNAIQALKDKANMIIVRYE